MLPHLQCLSRQSGSVSQILSLRYTSIKDSSIGFKKWDQCNALRRLFPHPSTKPTRSCSITFALCWTSLKFGRNSNPWLPQFTCFESLSFLNLWFWGLKQQDHKHTFVISTVVVQSKDTSDIMFLFFGMAGGGVDRQGRGLTLEWCHLPKQAKILWLCDSFGGQSHDNVDDNCIEWWTADRGQI